MSAYTGIMVTLQPVTIEQVCRPAKRALNFPAFPFVLSMQPVSWVGSSQLYLSQQPYLQLQGGAAALCLIIVPLKAHNLVFCFSQLHVLHFYLHAADKPEAPEYIAFATPPFVYNNDWYVAFLTNWFSRLVYGNSGKCLSHIQRIQGGVFKCLVLSKHQYKTKRYSV